ncbi:MAG: integrating conjugative element protein [Hydrogenophaga sp.]
MKHHAITLLAAAVLCLSAQSVSHAQTSRSTLYYQLGGSAPGGGANYRTQIPIQIGLAADLRLSYSCGKFDIGLSWTTLMNNISDFGHTLEAALQAGVAALPMYIFHRAQPGLYQLFVKYSAKADAMIAASLKTCEGMEEMIKNGENPYEEWVSLAKGEAWRVRASLEGDVVEAKTAINRDQEGQRNGVSWVFGGAKAGGVGLQPLRPIRDLSVAGYNVTLNRPPTAGGGGGAPADARIGRTFRSPEELATWTTRVLGDQQIYLCEGITNCPAATTSSTASGLGPLLEDEIDRIRIQLTAMVTGSMPANNARLGEIAAPGISVMPEVVQAMRSMPVESRNLAIGRLSHEMAMQRIVDQALVARQVLITSLTLPEVTAAGHVKTDVQAKIATLTGHIEDLMFEHRIRKDMTSETALSILEANARRDGQSSAIGQPGRADPAPLEGGRVRTAPAATPAP